MEDIPRDLLGGKQAAQPETKLAGIVEADETYVGGYRKGEAGGPSAQRTKAIVYSLSSRDGDVRSFHIPDVKAERPFRTRRDSLSSVMR